MSGIFKGTGTLGPAPTTVWFGSLPDRLNMLRPGHDDFDYGSDKPLDGLLAANYLNQWTIWNLLYGNGADSVTATLGAFTTAPDGMTNTAQKLVESSDNTRHFVTTLCSTASTLQPGKIRLAGFFKYAGRRVAITVATPAQGAPSGFTPFDASNYGVRAIFDLQNGQVGIDSTKFGPIEFAWRSYPAQMIHFGDGWYLCYMDVYIDNATILIAYGAHTYCYVELDNGTGTGAASLTYAGDGASGVYGWRTNMMPPASWEISNTVFFDDFDDNSRSNFDLANTLDPTKAWFIRNGTPYVPNSYDPVTPIEDLVVSNSVLNITPTTAPTLTLATYAALTQEEIPSGYVGQGWKPPLLFECRARWDMASDSFNGNQTATMWAWSLEYVLGHPDPDQTQGPPPDDLIGREIDIFESSGGGGGSNARPKATAITYYATRHVENQGSTFCSYGYPAWDSVHNYPNDMIVFYNGSYYQSNKDWNINSEPPSADWDNYSASGPPPAVTVDWNEFQIFQTLVLPYKSGDTGKILQFLNGVFVGFVSNWAPMAASGNTHMQVSDGHRLPIMLGGAAGFNSYFDWVRVTQ